MMQVRTGDQALVKQLNKAIVLNILRSQSPISRAAIAKVSGLNKATVSALVDELAADRMVTELGPGESSGGRRPNLLMLNEQAGVVAGIDLGVGHLRVVLMDLRAQVRWRRRVACDPTRGPEQCFDQIAALVSEGLAALPATPRGLLGAGVGAPGLVDHHEGRLIFAPNLHWQDVAIAEPLRDRLGGVPVLVDNEANAGAVGELWAGCAQNVRSLVFLSVGIGLGAGIVLNREVYRGAGGVAGELGHTTIDVTGPVCSCGNRGCWEMFASETALRQQMTRRKPGGASPTTEDVVQAAQVGDPAAIAALSAVGEYLGIGIANVINTFNPPLVVIGSGIAEGGSYILNPARRAVEQRALAYPRSGVQIVLSALGAEACAIGAGALVLQDQFRLPTVAL